MFAHPRRLACPAAESAPPVRDECLSLFFMLGLGEGSWVGWEHFNLPPNSHRDKFDVV